MTTLARVPDVVGTRARRLRGPLATAAILGVATLALRVHDPHQHGSWGLCPFKAITGWDCPACGGLRAVNDLGHGQVVEAAHSNLVFVGSLPLLLGLWLLWLGRGWTGDDRRVLPSRVVRPLTIAAAAVVLVFTIYRNTPWGAAWHVA
jgi:hypothetical protein